MKSNPDGKEAARGDVMTLPGKRPPSQLKKTVFYIRDTKLSGVILIGLLLLLWQGLSVYEIVHPIYIPPVSKIFRALYDIIISGELPLHYAHSLYRTFTGYFIAAFLAIGLGIIIGWSRTAFNLTEPLTELARPVPSPAIIPMIILLLGIGDQMKIFIIGWACFWPILVNTIDGVRSVDRVVVDTARTFGSTQKEILRKIIIPAASPSIVTGMRIALAVALILTVISEMIAGRNGIGFFILDSERTFRVPEMYAGTFSLAAVGYSLNRVFVAADRKFMGWHKGMISKEMR